MINRDKEQRFLHNFFATQMGNKRSLFLCSASGIGKSYLVDHVVSRIEHQQPYIVVGNGTKYEGSPYIQQLARSLNEVATKTGKLHSLSQFQELENSRDKEKAIKIIAAAETPVRDVLTHKIPKVTPFLSSLFTPKESIDNILYGQSHDALISCGKYVFYSLSHHGTIVRINKYNEIDASSDFLIRNVYDNISNIIIILEITSDGEKEDVKPHYIRLKAHFDNDKNQFEHITQIDKKHILNHYKNLFGETNVKRAELFGEIYQKSNGNFNEFEFVIGNRKSLIEGDLNDGFKDDLHSQLKSMPKNCKRLISLVISVPYGLKLSPIQDVFEKFFHEDMDEVASAIEWLKSNTKELLVFEDNTIKLKYDYLRNFLNDSESMQLTNIEARSKLISYYYSISQNSFSNDQKYESLISISGLIIQNRGSSDSSIPISTLRNLDIFSYPTNKCELSKSILQLFNNYVIVARENEKQESGIRELDMVYEEICKILYRIGYLEELVNIADRYSRFLPIDKHNDRLRLTIMSSKVLIGDASSIEEIERIGNHNSFLYYGSRLLLILYYRTFDKDIKAKKLWKRLKNSSNIENTPLKGIFYEYGALTRLINLSSRIRLLEKAEKYNTKHNYNFHAASCGIAISATLLYFPIYSRKKVKKSKEKFIELRDRLANTRIMDHIFENQSAITEMREGITNVKTFEKLMDAYNRCAFFPDKLLIGSNLVSCYIALKALGENVINIDTYVSDILDITRMYRNRNSEFYRYSLAACYRYYRSTDNMKMVREIRENDLANMNGYFYLFNIGAPRNIIMRIFIKYIYSQLYLVLWPKIMPVHNWTIDFYSIEESFE